MKKTFLLWLLSISLATASNIKEDSTFTVHSVPHTIPGERLEDWTLQGNFDRIFNSDSGINRRLTIKPIFNNSPIKDIFLSGYGSDNYKIFINTTNKINVELSFKFTQKFSCGFYLPKSFMAENHQDFSELLAFFYQKQYLPDCIIDVILNEFAQQQVVIDDFRLTSEKIASDLNQALAANSCEQDVQTFLTQKLANVTPAARRQHLIAEVLINLHENNPGMSLIKTWISEVTDPLATPLYGQIKLIQSDIEMNDVTQPDQQKRYAQALQTLLNIPSPWVTSDIQRQINLLVKYIYNNNQFNTNALPSALENLQLNAASMVDMLVYMSKLSQTREEP